MLSCIIVLCKLMQLEAYSYSLEERYHQNTVSLFFESLLKLSEGGEIKKCWITQRWKRSMYKRKRVLKNHELYLSAQKDMTILYLSIILKASFSEGFLALQNKECLHCSAKQPGSISHECWITLGVPRCVLRMRVLWFYNDSNMVKRYSVKPIGDSFHRHGSSVLLNAINENCSRCFVVVDSSIVSIEAHSTLNFIC